MTGVALIFVPDLITAVSPVLAVDALYRAATKVLGEPCGDTLLTTLAAHTALETGRWQKMHHYNFGNLRGAHNGKWTSFIAGENDHGHPIVLKPGPDNMFRPYDSLDEGADSYCRFLGVAEHPPKTNIFQAAWDAACAGNLDGFVRGLCAGHYFTANPESYQRGIESLVPFVATFVAERSAALAQDPDPECA